MKFTSQREGCSQKGIEIGRKQFVESKSVQIRPAAFNAERHNMEEVMEETVTITKQEHERLLKAAAKLSWLEDGGVDNWEGYEDAMAKLAVANAE